MPNKTTKVNRRNAGKQNDHGPREKDDGTRWLVVRHGALVYGSTGGIIRSEAERLAAGLLEPAQIMQVE